jgi:hypothetical protein
MTAFKELLIGGYVLRFWPSDNGWMCGITPQMMDALEANEFNPDWDTQAVLTEEIQRMAKRIEELEAKDEPYALEASMFSNDKVKVDPVTGNVSIGTPQRTWVGLTDEEIEDFVSALWPVGAGAGKLLRAIEAKLKEKNT